MPETATEVRQALISRPAINESEMSATAVINTPAIDRDTEVIIPTGVHVENYRRNPVVLWNHGFGSSDLPIAKCETPDGELALDVSEDGIVATSYFAQSHKMSEQIFDLIVQKIIRATSISVLPISGHKERVDGEEVLVIDESDMGEWSWVHVGANPEAVAKVLGHGRLAGSPIAGPLRKSLRAVVPARRTFGRGADFSDAEQFDRIARNFSAILKKLDNFVDRQAGRSKLSDHVPGVLGDTTATPIGLNVGRRDPTSTPEPPKPPKQEKRPPPPTMDSVVRILAYVERAMADDIDAAREFLRGFLDLLASLDRAVVAGEISREEANARLGRLANHAQSRND